MNKKYFLPQDSKNTYYFTPNSPQNKTKHQKKSFKYFPIVNYKKA